MVVLALHVSKCGWFDTWTLNKEQENGSQTEWTAPTYTPAKWAYRMRECVCERGRVSKVAEREVANMDLCMFEFV